MDAGIGLKSNIFCDVLVSTDDPSIADCANKIGAMVPWLRPSELATDTASPVDVIIHALDWYEEIHGKLDGVMLLQPTQPFRRMETIYNSIKLFKQKNYKPIVSVSNAKVNPAWCFVQAGAEMVPCMGWDKVNLQSQDLPSAFVNDGLLFIIAPENLRKSKSFISRGFVPYFTTSYIEAIDIDDEADWEEAEMALSKMNAQ